MFSVGVSSGNFYQGSRKDNLVGFAQLLDCRLRNTMMFIKEPCEPELNPSWTSLSPENKQALLKKLVIMALPKFFEKNKAFCGIIIMSVPSLALILVLRMWFSIRLLSFQRILYMSGSSGFSLSIDKPSMIVLMSC